MSLYSTNADLCDKLVASAKDIEKKGKNMQFTSANGHMSNLEKADFRESFNYTIDPFNNNIKKAKFKMPEAVGLIKPLDIKLID